jgi:polyisoprenoid-binding protein YceI
MIYRDKEILLGYQGLMNLQFFKSSSSFRLLVLTLTITFSQTLFAKTLVVNPDHSSVQLSIKYLNWMDVSGTFEKFSGELDYDDATRTPKSLNAEIEMTSLNTQNSKRDQHLKGPDFFAVQTFPKATFSSSSISPINSKTWKVRGELKLKDVSRQVEFVMTKLGEVTDTWDFENLFFQLTTSLKRKDFGITWNKTLDEGGFLLGEDVQFVSKVQMQPKGRITPSIRHMLPDTQSIREREGMTQEEFDQMQVDLKAKTDIPVFISSGQKSYPRPENKPLSENTKWLLVIGQMLFGIVGALAMSWGLKNLKMVKTTWVSDALALLPILVYCFISLKVYF